MRVLLINPFYPLTEMPSPPLGLAYVAAAFEQMEAAVKILDLVVEPYNSQMLEKLLNEFQPELVGATAVTMTFNAAISVLKDVKKIAPRITTLMGGPHISFYAEETLKEHPELDIGVLGEGEQTIYDLVTCVKQAEGRPDKGILSSDVDLSGVAGLAYRDGKHICLTATRPPSMNVKLLPRPARHLLALGRYKALGLAVSMITSRGCPFQCIFCIGRKMSGSKVRYRDPIAVVDEMEYLHLLGFYQINVADDLFTAKKAHCFAICDEIIRRKLEVKWTAFSRANTISRPLLAKLKEAGCVHLSFGFESANEDILKTVQKRINRQQMIDAAQMCREEGMPAQASFIYGLPGESEATLRETAEFGDRLDEMGTSVGFHLLAPFPGTAVRDRAESYGIRILTDDWSQYTANTAIVEPRGLTAAQLEERPNEMDRLAYQRIGEIIQRSQTGEASDAEMASIEKLQRMDIYYKMMMLNLITSPPAICEESLPKDTVEVQSMVKRALGSINYPAERIEYAVSYGLDQNFLGVAKTGSADTWYWKDLS
jgi:radical SAM superfamily enzyme YgiQ (UPF0313 family)